MADSILLTNIGTLYGILDADKDRLAGHEMSQVHSISNAYLHISKGLINSFGQMPAIDKPADCQILDVNGRAVLPVWCDSHTHLVYSKNREAEYVQRIKGASYVEIASSGGGILNSAKHLNNTNEDDLYNTALDRLNEIISLGTGAVEIKSGYGLTEDSELKMLRVIKRLKEKSPIPIKATFLGAHAIPEEFKENREGYFNLLIENLLPQIHEKGLADYMDVFCDKGFFTRIETDRLLKAGWKYGLQPKIHANELDYSGGVQVGVANNALSVDHLECVGKGEIDVLADSKTMPTLLPSTAFFLNIGYAPARSLIDAGLPVALASDYNPGSSPSGNMALIQTLACLKMNMTPEESFNACTINGAYAIGLSDQIGSITVGKIGSVQIANIDRLSSISYSFGSQLIDQVVINGLITNQV